MPNKKAHDRLWMIKCYSRFNSNNVLTIPNAQMRLMFFSHTLRISDDGELNDLIYITPETYVLYSKFNLGILSFDTHHSGKWALSFHDESSAIDCIKTLKSNGIEVTDVQKILSDRRDLESTINQTIKNARFPDFVAEVEKAMKNNNA